MQEECERRKQGLLLMLAYKSHVHSQDRKMHPADHLSCWAGGYPEAVQKRRNRDTVRLLFLWFFPTFTSQVTGCEGLLFTVAPAAQPLIVQATTRRAPPGWMLQRLRQYPDHQNMRHPPPASSE
jgi:hypothetical protein